MSAQDAIVPASSVMVRTMADGTLRVSVDIEPRHAQTAFVLFGAPGTPIALAALKVGTQLEKDQSTEPAAETTKGGPLAKWAAMRCQDVRFQKWIGVDGEYAARQNILRVCGIKSRAELDNDKQAAELFDYHFRNPWGTYCEMQGWND